MDWTLEDQMLSDSLSGNGPEPLPDEFCITTPDGDCISNHPKCIHQIRKPRFVTRTIKNSRVRVFGRSYVCETPLPEQLQIRACFGLYYTGGELEDTIILWGSLDMKRAVNQEAFHKAWLENPFCINGVFEYQWWRREETTT